MRNLFHFYILLSCTAASHASVPIHRAFRLGFLGAKTTFAMPVGVHYYSMNN